MKNQHLPQPNLNIEELKLIEQLRGHSQLRERLPGILRMADDIEALLIEAMRRVGQATMESRARPDGLLAFFTKWSGVERKGGILLTAPRRWRVM